MAKATNTATQDTAIVNPAIAEQNEQQAPAVDMPTFIPSEGKVLDTKFGTINVTVIKATKTADEKGYIVKLQHKSVKQLKNWLGVKTQPVQFTFYVKQESLPELGASGDLNIDEYKVVERPYKVEDADSELYGTTIQCKWLHLK